MEFKSKFMHAVANDSPISKLWKFRYLLISDPAEAEPIRQKMLDFAIKN
jgi:hypothetical protein